MVYQTNFTDDQNAKLSELDRIALADGFYAVSGDHILQTGEAHIYGDYSSQNQNVDLTKDDKFNRALDKIYDNAKAILEGKMLSDPALANAFARVKTQDPPDPADLATTDKALFEAISIAHDGIEAFNNYRIEGDNGTAERRTNNVNEIGNDADHKIEHDCETMSIVEVIVATRLSKDTDLQAGNGSTYFFTGGGVKHSDRQKAGGHAYIVAVDPDGRGDMAIIEATIDPSTYTQSPYRYTDAKFGQFVAGEPIAVKDSADNISIYGALNAGTKYDWDTTLRRANDIQLGYFDDLQYSSYINDITKVDDYFLGTMNQTPDITPTALEPTALVPTPVLPTTPLYPPPISPAPMNLLDDLGIFGVMPFNQNIHDFQQALKDSGYEIDVDGRAGNQTRDVANQYIQDTGAFDLYNKPTSYAATFINIHSQPQPIDNSPRAIQSSGTHVVFPPNPQLQDIQEKLLQAGFDPNGIDGLEGTGTRNAIISYAQANDLNPYSLTLSGLENSLDQTLGINANATLATQAWDGNIAKKYYTTAAKQQTNGSSPLSEQFSTASQGTLLQPDQEAALERGPPGPQHNNSNYGMG